MIGGGMIGSEKYILEKLLRFNPRVSQDVLMKFAITGSWSQLFDDQYRRKVVGWGRRDRRYVWRDGDRWSTSEHGEATFDTLEAACAAVDELDRADGVVWLEDK